MMLERPAVARPAQAICASAVGRDLDMVLKSARRARLALEVPWDQDDRGV